MLNGQVNTGLPELDYHRTVYLVETELYSYSPLEITQVFLTLNIVHHLKGPPKLKVCLTFNIIGSPLEKFKLMHLYEA